MSDKITVITGGGSGIGRALAHHLAQMGQTVWIVGRRKEPLEETRSAYPENIHIAVADVSMPEGRRDVIAALGTNARIANVVHNAAVLQPVCAMADMVLEDWRYHMAVNVEGPLFLTQALLPHLEEGSRILHISSGAAHSAYQGWGAYCTSKAALHMVYRCLDMELKSKGIRVGSARPGVVDTPMQNQVRASSPDAFPNLPRFMELKEKGELVDPKLTVKFLSWLLMDVDAQRFAREEWDYRNEDQHGNAFLS